MFGQARDQTRAPSVTSFVALWTCQRGTVDVSLTIFPFIASASEDRTIVSLKIYCFSLFPFKSERRRLESVRYGPDF